MSSKSNTPRFEITSVKFVERDRSPRHGSMFGRPRIYVWVKDETVLENFFERRSRPYLVWKRQIVPQVLPLLRAHIERGGSSSYAWAGGDPKVRWSQKAGCSCGCSPAFIVEATHDHDVHVDVAVMDSVPVQQWGQAVEKVRAEIAAEIAEREAAKAAKADDYSPDTSEVFDADDAVVIQAKHLKQQRELESRELISVTDVQPSMALYQSLRGERVGTVTSVDQRVSFPRTVRIHLDTGGFLSYTAHALVAVSPSQTPLERALEIVNELDRDEVVQPCNDCDGDGTVETRDGDQSCQSCEGEGKIVAVDFAADVDRKLARLHRTLDQRGAPLTDTPQSSAEKQRRIAQHGTEKLNQLLADNGHYPFPSNASPSDVAAYFLTAVSLSSVADELAAAPPSTAFVSKEDPNRPVALSMFSGGSIEYRTADGREHRAELALYLIRLAWQRGVDFESEADGFGAGEGTKGDWSAIRDSSAPAQAAMLLKALTSLNLY